MEIMLIISDVTKKIICNTALYSSRVHSCLTTLLLLCIYVVNQVLLLLEFMDILVSWIVAFDMICSVSHYY